MTGIRSQSVVEARLIAVCFDATGTLFEATASVGEVYSEVASDYGISLPAWRLDDAFMRILRHAPPRGLEGNDEESRSEQEQAWWTERIRQTFQATDSTVRFTDFPGFAQALFDHYRRGGAWQLRPGVRDLLTELGACEIPMAIASNFDHRLPEVLEMLEIHDHFTEVAIPSKIGASKPEPAVFERVLQSLGCRAEQLLYVGDDDHEVMTAIEGLGIRTLSVLDDSTEKSWTERVSSAFS